MQFQPTEDMVKHWLVLAVYVSLAMTFLRVLGRGIGPLVKERSPALYTVIASLWAALEVTMNDAFRIFLAPRAASQPQPEKTDNQPPAA